MERVHLLVDTLNVHIHQPVNCLTHFLGAVFSLVGMVILLTVSQGELLYMASFAVYGFSSVLLYMASALFHGLKVDPEQRRFLLKLDHVGIFMLIAGSYTPIALLTLTMHSPALGWGFFISVWTVAMVGMYLKLKFLDAPHWLSTSFYLLLGWAAIFALSPMSQILPVEAMALMFMGGIFYSVGAVVFVLQRPNLYPGVLEHHELWHLFVLAGGACHFLMMLLYITPGKL